MNWDALGAVAELLGAFAVIATLVYLSFQVKQNSKIAMAQAWRESIVAWESVSSEMIANSHAMNAAMLDINSVTDDAEFDVLMARANRFQQAHYVIWKMVQLEQIASSELTSYDGVVAMFLATSFGKRHWKHVSKTWVEDYRKHIDDLAESYEGPSWNEFVVSIRQGQGDDA